MGEEGIAARLTIVRLESPDETETWDRFVSRAEGSSFCHLSGWRRVVGEAMGHESIYLMARDEVGMCVGLLPLVRVRTPLLGHYLLSMPFLNYGGAIGTPEARQALSNRAVEIARESQVDLLELRGRGLPSDPPLRTVSRKITVVLDLPEDPKVLWEEGIRAKVRSQIRRPQKEGMTVRLGPAELVPFYRVFAENMRDLGTPVLPLSFFQGILEHFPEVVEFGTVYHGGEPVASGCGFQWRNEFEMTWASSLRRFNPMSPNMLLYWGFMEEMTRRGLRKFNFGRCTPGGGTHRFKSQWGGKDEPLPWGQWSSSGASETPNPDRPLFQLAVRLWSRLPLAVANRLGPPLARRLP